MISICSFIEITKRDQCDRIGSEEIAQAFTSLGMDYNFRRKWGTPIVLTLSDSVGESIVGFALIVTDSKIKISKEWQNSVGLLGWLPVAHVDEHLKYSDFGFCCIGNNCVVDVYCAIMPDILKRFAVHFQYFWDICNFISSISSVGVLSAKVPNGKKISILRI